MALATRSLLSGITVQPALQFCHVQHTSSVLSVPKAKAMALSGPCKSPRTLRRRYHCCFRSPGISCAHHKLWDSLLNTQETVRAACRNKTVPSSSLWETVSGNHLVSSLRSWDPDTIHKTTNSQNHFRFQHG